MILDWIACPRFLKHQHRNLQDLRMKLIVFFSPDRPWMNDCFWSYESFHFTVNSSLFFKSLYKSSRLPLRSIIITWSIISFSHERFSKKAANLGLYAKSQEASHELTRKDQPNDKRFAKVDINAATAATLTPSALMLDLHLRVYTLIN